MQSADELLIKISIWSKTLKQNKVLQNDRVIYLIREKVIYY